MTEIGDGVFQGNLDEASNWELLQEHDIRSLLTLCEYLPQWEQHPVDVFVKVRQKRQVVVAHVPLPDDLMQPVPEDLVDLAVNLIELLPKNILVHCHHGMTRSGAVIMAWLMRHERLSLKEAADRLFDLHGRKVRAHYPSAVSDDETPYWQTLKALEKKYRR